MVEPNSSKSCGSPYSGSRCRRVRPSIRTTINTNNMRRLILVTNRSSTIKTKVASGRRILVKKKRPKTMSWVLNLINHDRCFCSVLMSGGSSWHTAVDDRSTGGMKGGKAGTTARQQGHHDQKEPNGQLREMTNGHASKGQSAEIQKKMP